MMKIVLVVYIYNYLDARLGRDITTLTTAHSAGCECYGFYITWMVIECMKNTILPRCLRVLLMAQIFIMILPIFLLDVMCLLLKTMLKASNLRSQMFMVSATMLGLRINALADSFHMVDTTVVPISTVFDLLISIWAVILQYAMIDQVCSLCFLFAICLSYSKVCFPFSENRRHIVDEHVLRDDIQTKEKDIDGFHPLNIVWLAMRGRDTLFAPHTPKGCIELLHRQGEWTSLNCSTGEVMMDHLEYEKKNKQGKSALLEAWKQIMTMENMSRRRQQLSVMQVYMAFGDPFFSIPYNCLSTPTVDLDLLTKPPYLRWIQGDLEHSARHMVGGTCIEHGLFHEVFSLNSSLVIFHMVF